jgi:maleylpyruvate isomerase
VSAPADPSTDLAALAAALDEMAAATDRLILDVDQLGDADLREASLLPGWTRGHVLTHVGRNADGMVNLVTWARTGEETPMYAGGREGRAAAIEAGAGRHIGDIRLDLNDSGERLLGAFAGLPTEALAREVVFGSGATAYGWELPSMRTREVEIHHVDLDCGYTPAHWSTAFVHRTLDQLAPQFRTRGECPVGWLADTDSDQTWQTAEDGPTLAGPGSGLLAWLTGRSDGDGLDLDPAGPVPRAPRWG